MRQSGILMHLTSLPGPYGVGTMGKSAFDFVDFLKAAGQTCWQILPLNPTGYGDSPYQSCSTFAGNPYLIDLDALVEAGLLTREELDARHWCETEDRVDFGNLYVVKYEVLRLAFSRFTDYKTLDAFCHQQESWIYDYAIFMALKDENGGKPWLSWPEELRNRNDAALGAKYQQLEKEVYFYCFIQYLFYTQWNQLLAYAHKNGITVIGDVPIYVPLDSADVWANPGLFQMDEKGEPTAVAGCPPDAFSADGQLWGNPLYHWDVMAQDGYRWWIARLAAAGKLYDVVRMDHFRGLESYWSIPYGDKTAKGGKWVKGPGMDFVSTVKRQLPELKLIAEDLGYLTQEVLDLRDASGYPGMKVLGFAFDSREPSNYLPHSYLPNSVCYTGTHDNMTTRQWFDTAPADAVLYAKHYMGLTEAEGYTWGMIRTALGSVSDLCIIPMQDYLDLGAEARMNFPGTLSNSNWTWRGSCDIMSKDLAQKIHDLTKLYGRI